MQIRKVSVFFACILLLPASGIAETTKYISIGLTQTDNLEIQPDFDVNLNNADTRRSGILTGLSLQKQSFDFSGGYILEADIDYNKGLNNTGDISNIGFSASKLKAISPNWLMRSSIMLRHYNNEALAVNSYDGVRLENTFGYLNDNNSGTDIVLNLGRENHTQDALDRYKTQKTGVKISQYFPHENNAPYWSINMGITQNNADNDQRDFDSYTIGIESRQWRLGSLRGTAGIQWQTDRYKQLAGESSKREDGTVIFQANISKRIKKNTALLISATTGRYQSSRNDVNEKFYQLISNLQWQF